jgi:hypothetical protein
LSIFAIWTFNHISPWIAFLIALGEIIFIINLVKKEIEED